MSLASKITASVILVLICFSIAFPQSIPKQSDRWFARDKYEHFALSVFYAGGTTLIAHRHFEQSNSHSMAIGFGVAVTLGAGKEDADYITRKGTPSIKDFIWDVAGALTGALIVGLSL